MRAAENLGRFTCRLRAGWPMRKRRWRANARGVRFVAPAVLIDHRPEIVAGRVRVGDWEGALIIGRGGLSAFGTVVERTNRYVKLVHVPASRTAPNLQVAMAVVMAALPTTAWLTLTWDQGTEMAGHDQIAAGFPDRIYFAHPSCPWQRASNENRRVQRAPAPALPRAVTCPSTPPPTWTVSAQDSTTDRAND